MSVSNFCTSGEKWPTDVYITVSKGGTMTESLLEEWTEAVYNKRPGGLFQQPNILVLDSATCHKKEAIEGKSRRCQVSHYSRM